MKKLSSESSIYKIFIKLLQVGIFILIMYFNPPEPGLLYLITSLFIVFFGMMAVVVAGSLFILIYNLFIAVDYKAKWIAFKVKVKTAYHLFMADEWHFICSRDDRAGNSFWESDLTKTSDFRLTIILQVEKVCPIETIVYRQSEKVIHEARNILDESATDI